MKKLIILLLLFGCSSLQTTGIKGKSKTYIVKAGQHEMEGGRIMLLKKSFYSFTVETDSSWYWETPEKNGFSKVTGVGFLNMNGDNSARLVYINRKNNVHEFWAYIYKNNTSPQQDKTLKKKLIDVEIGKSYTGKVGYVDGWFYVEIGGQHYSIKTNSAVGVPFLQNPYIGGTYTIDHDWKVNIKYY